MFFKNILGKGESAGVSFPHYVFFHYLDNEINIASIILKKQTVITVLVLKATESINP